MEQLGYVVAAEGEHATVRVMRESACGRIHGGCADCKGCSHTKEHRVVVENTLHAAVGDTVLLYTDTKKMLCYLCAFFFYPVLLFVATFVLLTVLAVTLSALFAGCVLVLYVMGVALWARKKQWGKNSIQMIRVMSEKNPVFYDVQTM